MKMEIKEAQDTLVVVNTQPRGFGLPAIPDECFRITIVDGKNIPAKVDIKSLLDKEEQGKTLLPGENTISKAYWAYAKPNPCVKMAVRGGHIKIVREGEAVPLSVDWDKAPLDKLQAFLKNVDDIAVVNDVKAKIGKRKKHLALCEKRIDELLESAEK